MHQDVSESRRIVEDTRLKLDLGLRLQRRRIECGLTQGQAAAAAGVSLKYYGEIERGEANVTVDALAKVASALDWDPWSLFGKRGPGISQAVHALLMSELVSMQGRIGLLVSWMGSLNPWNEEAPTLPANDRTMVNGSATGLAAPRRRGRPVKRVVPQPRETLVGT